MSWLELRGAGAIRLRARVVAEGDVVERDERPPFCRRLELEGERDRGEGVRMAALLAKVVRDLREDGSAPIGRQAAESGQGGAQEPPRACVVTGARQKISRVPEADAGAFRLGLGSREIGRD